MLEKRLNYLDKLFFQNSIKSSIAISGSLALSPNVEYSQLSVSSDRKLACLVQQQNKRILFIDLDSPPDDDEDEGNDEDEENMSNEMCDLSNDTIRQPSAQVGNFFEDEIEFEDGYEYEPEWLPNAD